MEYELSNRPAYTLAEVTLNPGDSVTAQAGTLVTHTESIQITTGIGDSNEGLLESVTDSVLGGESLFRNRFTAEGSPGVVTLGPALPGDMDVIDVEDESLYLHSGAYVAADSGIELDTDVGGLGSLLGGEGLFFLKASGTGPLFVSSFGGIVQYDVDPGEVFTVDSGHAVAWDADLEYTTERIGGLKETLFSEEGLVLRFTGPGRVYVQTRNYDDFVSDLASRMPSDSDNGGGGFQIDF